MVKETYIVQIQPKGDIILPKAIFTGCYHGNCTNWVQSCAKFDAHTHYHFQVINTNRCTIVVYYA